jgi:hypothetical protein
MLSVQVLVVRGGDSQLGDMKTQPSSAFHVTHKPSTILHFLNFSGASHLHLSPAYTIQFLTMVWDSVELPFLNILLPKDPLPTTD